MMELGELPAGWSKATVGEVATLFRGVTYSKDQASNSPQIGMKPILRGNNINGELNFDDLVYVPEALIAPEQLISTGDIIFAMSSGSKHLVGKSAKARISFDGGFGAFCGLLRATEAINKDFLHYVFQGSDFRRAISEISKGSNINNLKREHILDFEFSCPPLAEQHRIVAKIEELFSELDQGVASLKTAREQLKVYRQSLLKNAFEGKLTAAWRAAHCDQLETATALQQRIARERQTRYQQQLADWQTAGQTGPKPKRPKPLPPLTAEELADLPELPEAWGWVKTGDLGTLGTGVTPLKSRTDFYTGGTIPWVTSGALNANYVTEASDYVTSIALRETNLRLYPKHALLVALYGEGKTRGKCSELLIEATTNQAIAAIVLDGTAAILRPYIKWYFQKNYGDIRLKSSGGVQPNLNLGIIENTCVPICSLAEATQLVEIIESKLSEADQLDQTLATALQQADALRQSILKKAFCGQLVKQDKNEEPATALLERIRATQHLSAKRSSRSSPK